ncbi:hypothetical protein C5O00_09540 [Pukyongia salina]|uniref:Uncharacterized protein n=1 Tax=Pukyongia salina TaxID=2094025 RepID=A0A2S0HXR2_9FLAO|nr:hypothetical protein [Pukyongia salina]AVI51400.1 hypothetical protein C5O00_09540 [Pukyongia salina]
MEEQFKKEDRILKKLISEAGTEKLGSNFNMKLMEQIEQRASERIQYQPLISKKGWVLLSIIFILPTLLYFTIPVELNGLPFDLPWKSLGQMLPEFKISKVFMYGTIFLALFFLQIPLLKKYVEAKY